MTTPRNHYKEISKNLEKILETHEIRTCNCRECGIVLSNVDDRFRVIAQFRGLKKEIPPPCIRISDKPYCFECSRIVKRFSNEERRGA